MKRLGMVVAALVMVATMGFAQQSNDVKGMSFEKLSKYLQLSSSQLDEVSRINEYFANQLGGTISAETICNNERPAEAQNALLCNLKLMKQSLTKEQYRKYVTLINVTLENQEGSFLSDVLNNYLAEK